MICMEKSIWWTKGFRSEKRGEMRLLEVKNGGKMRLSKVKNGGKLYKTTAIKRK